MELEITPIETQITKLIIGNVAVTLNECAKVFYQKATSDNSVIEEGWIEVPTEDYNNWGTDDQFIINFVKTSLSLF